MIKSIQLKNFQSHENNLLEFAAPGVNVIVGSSDSGKTSILRALNWVRTNRPSGDAFRSYWGGDTSVKIIFVDGKKAERWRTKSKNSYVLNGRTLEAFGQSVPEDVSAAFDMNEVNVQNQMDIPFLLSNNSGEVAQTLNRAVNLEIIDHSLSSISRKIRGIKSDIDAGEIALNKSEEDLSHYEGLDKVEKEVEELECLETQLIGKRNRVEQLKTHRNDANRYMSLLNQSSLVLKGKGLVEESLTKAEEAERRRGMLRIIIGLVDEGQEHRHKIKTCQLMTEEEHQVEGLIRINKEIQTRTSRMEDLESRLREYKQNQKRIVKLSSTLRTLEKDFHKQMPDICPLCGQVVSENRERKAQ